MERSGVAPALFLSIRFPVFSQLKEIHPDRLKIGLIDWGKMPVWAEKKYLRG
jgi:hypothetical protein